MYVVWPQFEANTQPHLGEMEVSGRRSRGRPKMRWRDISKEVMKKYQLTEDMAQDRTYWTSKITAGSAQGDCQEK